MRETLACSLYVTGDLDLPLANPKAKAALSRIGKGCFARDSELRRLRHPLLALPHSAVEV